MVRLIVVDDQANMRATTALMLRQVGYQVEEAATGAQALESIRARAVDVVLTDLRMEPMTGMELLSQIREVAPTTQVIVMTAYGSVDSAVEAMRVGATDYVQKPFTEEELLVRVSRAVEQRRLISEVAVLADEFRARYNLENIVGRSSVLREMLARVIRTAPTDTTVLITGESGTGKELVARALHSNSRRAARPFVTVNCAAISEQLLESELFGHARGSFTGAIAARRGLFEEADGGTFFFDEIAATSLNFQAKLLRTIQEHEIRRVGENVPLRVDARIIAATNVDLRLAIAEKRFREDLFYRLNVVPIRVPPLRERTEDIPMLATHFLARYNKREGTRKHLTESATRHLMNYEYPGNVRELENLVEKAAALSAVDELRPADFQFDQDDSHSSSNPSPEETPDPGPRALAAHVADAERAAIVDAIRRSDGHLDAAAKQLEISHTTLWRKMRRLGVQK